MKTLAVLLAALLVVSGCRSPWDRRLAEAGADPGITSFLEVRCMEGSDARVFFYTRGVSGKLRKLAEGDAYIGRNGLGKTREGDAMTPEGDFGTGTAFGIPPFSDTEMDYLQLHPGIIACDSEGPWYNTIVDTVGTGIRLTGEDMYATVPEYYYGLEIAYNAERIYPAGSAIFLHCKGAKTWTGGCVAVDRELMEMILRRGGRGMRVSIHPAD